MQIEIFSKVKDPRDLGNVKHELEDVLRMALISVLCDCEDCDDISDMVTDREEEFKAAGLLKLSNNVPSQSTSYTLCSRQSVYCRDRVSRSQFHGGEVSLRLHLVR
ncbi:MAG: transposase family protein [Duncaniella dubosii]|nr:transposase family protein [Duncaniella dubosii]